MDDDKKGAMHSMGANKAEQQAASSLAFSRPPVVEVIAEITFVGSPSKPGWSFEVGKSFLKKVYPDATKFEILQQVTYHDTPEQTVTARKDVLKVRARNSTGDVAVQVANDSLACFLLNKDSAGGYRFSRLTDQVQRCLPHYQEHFSPASISAISLYYADVIEIPGSRINTDDYFNLGVRVPKEIDETKTLGFFDVKLLVNMRDDGSRVVAIEFQSTPSRKPDHIGFRLTWNLRETLDGCDVPIQWIDTARKDLEDLFVRSLTPKCLALFGPETKVTDVTSSSS